VRKPKSRPRYVPEDIWLQAKNLILVCDKHENWVLAGTCSLCEGPDRKQRERGVRALPSDPYAKDES
jgi:hypothetical protein